ncbi:trypsin alpha-3-like [Oppia nitens]|uniref:trypsin alpha-3-like n=1 Tax=Oppia nitens TaxID=1686743 RepID=UPI0023DA3875|nr:trypsin alpha-3-like [Oppia nitens]
MVVVGAHHHYPSIESKIIGGHPGNIRQFPYQILIKIHTTNGGGGGYVQCGGSLISAYWVLSAAHCFYRGGITRTAQQVFIHDQYDGHQSVNDLALIRVADGQPFPYSSTIRPISMSNGYVADGVWAWVTGWGYLTANGKQIPDQFQVLQVRTSSLQLCKHVYNNIQPTMDNLCTTTGNTGICQGDSGGPLALNGQLIGVITSSPDRCGNGNPDIYMNVSAYRQWIYNIAGI